MQTSGQIPAGEDIMVEWWGSQTEEFAVLEGEEAWGVASGG